MNVLLILFCGERSDTSWNTKQRPCCVAAIRQSFVTCDRCRKENLCEGNTEECGGQCKHKNQNTRDLVRNKHHILACGRQGYRQFGSRRSWWWCNPVWKGWFGSKRSGLAELPQLPTYGQHETERKVKHHTRRVETVTVAQRKGFKRDSETMEVVLTMKTREAFWCSRNVDREWADHIRPDVSQWGFSFCFYLFFFGLCLWWSHCAVITLLKYLHIYSNYS